jgi:small-conductance mechanosensitive channel
LRSSRPSQRRADARSDLSGWCVPEHGILAEAEQTRTSIDAEDLGKLQGALAQIRESLARHNLTAAELQALREQIDPLSDSTSATLKRLESHLAAIKERLDQLGPKPDAKAPPTTAAITERSSLMSALIDSKRAPV